MVVYSVDPTLISKGHFPGAGKTNTYQAIGDAILVYRCLGVPGLSYDNTNPFASRAC